MQQYGYGTPMLTPGASNPNMVRRQIAGDLGYYGQAPVMAAGHYQPVGIPVSNAGYGTSTFSQFGTDPQLVRQHIGQDLGYGYSSMHANVPVHVQMQGYQPVQNQAYYQPAVYQQVMSGYPTEAQYVRQQIQQDIRAGMQPPTHVGHPTDQFSAPYAGGSLLHQYGTQPQVVQSHIQNDLQQGHYTIPATMTTNYPHPMGTGYTTHPQMGSTLSQFGSNPQMVRQHMQSDLNGYY